MSEINFTLLKSHDGTVSDLEFNRLIDVVARLVLNNGINYTVSRSAAGTVIQTNSAAIKAKCPFSVSTSAVAGDPTSLNVAISPGTVNQFVATNIFDTFPISTTGTFYVKASVTSDGENVTSFSYAADATEPSPIDATASSLPTSFDVLLAIIKDGKIYRVLGCGSIVLIPILAFITDKPSPAGPGELTYIPYYTWKVETT